MEEKNYNVNVPDGPEELLKKNRQLFRRYLSFFVVIFLIAASFYLGFNRGKSYSSGGGQAVILLFPSMKLFWTIKLLLIRQLTFLFFGKCGTW